jgi:hypothetical protein
MTAQKMDTALLRPLGCRKASLRPGQKQMCSNTTKGSETLTWKFFSAHPFFAMVRTTTSASTCSATPSTQLVISSSAASLVFQLESPKSARMEDGMSSMAIASESSGVCLNLNASKESEPGAAFPLVGRVAGGPFLVEVPAAVVDGFLAYEETREKGMKNHRMIRTLNVTHCWFCGRFRRRFLR